MQPISLFGFQFGEKKQPVVEIPKDERPFVTPQEFDGTVVVETGGGIFGTSYFDHSAVLNDENRFVIQYRNMSMYPECDNAISEIVDAAVVTDDEGTIVKLNLDNVSLSDPIKKRTQKCFSDILRMLNFDSDGADIFRRWYVDSKIVYAIIIDNDNTKAGIQNIIPIDPLKITKIKEVNKENTRVGNLSVSLVNQIREYYLYKNNDRETNFNTNGVGLQLSPDSVAYVHSGLIDYNTKRVVGYMHKAIRPLNMLRQLEDAMLVYRIARAPERRVFYVDTGKLPPVKANQFIGDFVNRFRNQIKYNSSSGEIRSDRHHVSVMEDIFIPRTEGSQGTKLDVLQGGQAMNQIEDVKIFQANVYKALNVPTSRLDTSSGFNTGRSVEISREEVKFHKFIKKIRKQFSKLFLAFLRIQLMMTGVLTDEDWKIIKHQIRFTWNTDNYFFQLTQLELLGERMKLLPIADQFVGKYFSSEELRKTILQQSDEDMQRIDKEMIKDQQRMQQEMMARSRAFQEQNTENEGTEE